MQANADLATERLRKAAEGERRLMAVVAADEPREVGVPVRGARPTLARPLWILAVCALVVLLRLTREALIPLVLAVLFSLILSGVVEALRRRRIPRGVSAVILLAICGVALGGAIDALWAPAQGWVQAAPRVLRVMEHRIRPARSAVLQLNDLAARASALTGSAVDTRSSAPGTSGSGVTAMDLLAETGWVLGGIVTVAVLTLLLLSAGPATLARMMAALAADLRAVHVLRTIDAIRVEVGRYYGTLALINLSLGAATTLGMWLLHMPNPMLWGAVAAVLNFVPYAGSAVTLAIVTIVALVTFDSVSQVLLVAATYLGLATIEGQIVEPLLFGRRLRLNPIVVFVTLWLGGWLWGIAGVLFALPALVAVRVAAAQPGGRGGVLRFIGDATQTPLDNELSERRLEIPLLLRKRQAR
jgi:predicted PurR-regulated permease PerM